MGKFYAVKKGRKVGIFNSWNECKQYVDGFPEAKYKSFTSYDDAYSFVYEIPSQKVDILLQEDEECEIKSYIDGSYDNEQKIYSYAGLIFYKGEKTEFSFAENDLSIVDLRNVAGEIKAAMYAMNFALDQKVRSIEIFYDYAGIESWATKEWKAKNDFTKQYVQFIDKISSKLHIKFSKVKAHSGDKYNEEVDRLAKKAILQVTNNEKKIMTSDDKQISYLNKLNEMKSIKKSLNIGMLIKGELFTQDYVYECFKQKWKSKKRKLNEINDIKTIYDSENLVFLCYVLNTSNEWEIIEVNKEEL